MRLIRESIIILKNWLKILLRLIREGDLYSNLYGVVGMLELVNNSRLIYSGVSLRM